MRTTVLVLLAIMAYPLNAMEPDQTEDSYFPQRLSASELLHSCTSSSLTDLGRRKQRYCQGFISGVEEGVRLYGNQSGEARSAGFCVPAGTTSKQLAKAYIKYASRNQSDLNRPASLIVVEALQSEFPC
jgi:hypothetical protein